MILEQQSVVALLDGLHARHRGACRTVRLACGRQDPDYPERPARRPMNPETVLWLALELRGGAFTREEFLAAWDAYPEHRAELEAVAAALETGWPA